jgi:hypothetical protein
MNNNKTLPLKEVAGLLGIHAETLRKKIHTLEIPHEIFMGNRIYLCPDTARKYLTTTINYSKNRED